MQKIIGQKNCRFSKTGVKIFKPLYAKNHKSEKIAGFQQKIRTMQKSSDFQRENMQKKNANMQIRKCKNQ